MVASAHPRHVLSGEDHVAWSELDESGHSRRRTDGRQGEHLTLDESLAIGKVFA
jgi:hypothetical protein